MTDLNNAVVLITGASGGFGRHMVEQCLSAGSRLFLTDRDDNALDALISERAAAGSGNRIAGRLAVDLSAADSHSRLFEAVRALDMNVDVLINNAGVGSYGRFDETPDEVWEAQMQVNLLAPMRLTRQFLPGMIERGRGHIVNISSMAGWAGSRGLAPYTASKFGLRGFGEAIRYELRDHGIPVTNVYPFFSRTPIIDSEQFGSLPRMRPPDGVMSQPADVVRAIIRGISANKAEVFPDRYARMLQFLVRHFPWAVPFLSRKMEARGRV